MIDYSKIYNSIENSRLNGWADQIQPQVEAVFQGSRWGDLPKWKEAIDRLPNVKPSLIDLTSSAIRVGKKDDCDDQTRTKIEEELRKLHPWRKGPFNIFDIQIDTEWRSDLKWERFVEHIQPLKDRLVLDIGCGSGYHCFRMAGEGAKLAIGIDPILVYVLQFHAINKYIEQKAVSVLPLGIDDMSEDLQCFDTVFSMGLLYHRRSPLDHLLQLQSFLREGGELVLETLVIDGKKGEALNPQGRYAKMPNVWFIPSTATLESWLKRMNFKNVRLIDVTKTTSEEQRVTDWMGFESLADFLNPADPNLTIEGYPAPKRAVFLAQK